MPQGTELATAYVSVLLETSRVPRQIRSMFDPADREATVAGRTIGNRLERGVARVDFSTPARRSFQEMEAAGQRSATAVASDFERAGGRIGDTFGTSLESAASRAGEAGGHGGEGFIAGFAPRVASLGTKAGPIGLALAGVGVVGLGAGALLAKGVMDGFSLSQERGVSQAQFGFTDQQMQTVGRAAGGAFGHAWGESVNANIGTAGTAIQAGLLNGDASAAEIQPVIEKLSTVSKLMGTEIPETARAAGQFVKTGLATNATEAFDLMTVAQQKGLNLSGDLLDTMTEYGTQYRKLGLDGATALGTISQMMQGGARDTDVAADALKEFAIRTRDVSDTNTQAAYQTLNLNLEDTANAFIKGGKSATDMANTVVAKIRAIQDPTQRALVTSQLFGTQYEDLGGALDKLDFSNAAAQFGQVGGATQAAGDKMSGAAGSIQAVKNQISIAADNIKLKLADAFAPTVINAAEWVEQNKDRIVAALAEGGSKALDFMATGTHVAAEVLRFSANTTGALATMFGGFIENVGQTSSVLGGILKHVPGMGDMGRALESTGNGAAAFGSEMQKGADRARAVADALDRNVVPGLRSAADSLHDTAEKSKETQAGLDHSRDAANNLNNALNSLPDNKPIRVDAPGGVATLNLLTQMGAKVSTDNNKNIQVDAPLAPAVLDVLSSLNLKVVTDNNKSIIVTDNGTAKLTGDAIDQYINKPRTAFIDVYPRLLKGDLPQSTDLGKGTATLPLDALTRAGGGEVRGPGGPRDDKVLMWGSNGEFMQQSAAVDYYGLKFMDDVNNMRLPRRATGGPVSKDDFDKLARGGFGASRPLEGASYDWSGINWGDCSATQSAFARLAAGLPPFGGRYATASAAGALKAMGALEGIGQAGDLQLAFYNGGPGGGHATTKLPSGVNVEMGGNRGNGQYGGAAADPNEARFNEKWHFPASLFGTMVGVIGGGDFSSLGTGLDRAPGTASAAGTGTDSTTGTSTAAAAKTVGTSLSEGLGNAASSFVSGQLKSLLGVLSINDTPGALAAVNEAQTQMNSARQQKPNVTDPGTTKPAPGQDLGGAATTATPPIAAIASTGNAIKDAFRSGLRSAWQAGQAWADSDWIVNKESTWNPLARNGKYFGLIQAGAEAYRAAGKDPNDPDPRDQGQVFDKYVGDRYQTPMGARAHWEANNWYDQGGEAIGTGLMAKNVLRPERVLSPSNTEAFNLMARRNFQETGGQGDVVDAIHQLIAVIRSRPTDTPVLFSDEHEYRSAVQKRRMSTALAGN